MKFLLTLLLFSPLICFTQNTIEKQLDSISTPEDATKFLKTHKSEEGKLYIFNKEKHKTRLAKELFKLSKGRKKVYKTDFKKTYYKIINKAEVDYYKFNIITTKLAVDKALNDRIPEVVTSRVEVALAKQKKEMEDKERSILEQIMKEHTTAERERNDLSGIRKLAKDRPEIGKDPKKPYTKSIDDKCKCS